MHVRYNKTYKTCMAFFCNNLGLRSIFYTKKEYIERHLHVMCILQLINEPSLLYEYPVEIG